MPRQRPFTVDRMPRGDFIVSDRFSEEFATRGPRKSELLQNKLNKARAIPSPHDVINPARSRDPLRIHFGSAARNDDASLRVKPSQARGHLPRLPIRLVRDGAAVDDAKLKALAFALSPT